MRPSPVRYDDIADDYGKRYERHDFTGVDRVIREFVGEQGVRGVLEVGCGTGHWLAQLASPSLRVAGVDTARRMLQHAGAAAPAALLIRARAEQLPVRGESFDRILCVNALHHFTRRDAFMAEARRVLRPGGGLVVVGLDPHTGADQWWIYDWFPEARVADLARYPAAAEIRRSMAAAGFVETDTREAHHIPSELSVAEAESLGLLERSSTSQLMVISDEAFRDGIDRIRAARPKPGEGQPRLRADLRLYATIGRLSSQRT